jgi:hypothetical protein
MLAQWKLKRCLYYDRTDGTLVVYEKNFIIVSILFAQGQNIDLMGRIYFYVWKTNNRQEIGGSGIGSSQSLFLSISLNN